MELGPRDKVSQAFWHEQRKGNTIKHPLGDVVHLDLRHLGEDYLKERLPFICELAKAYVNVDPAKEPIPIRPTAHYTMGGLETDPQTETQIKGLFAVGECSSVGLHGANRLGSNSLAELVVFGRLAGETAAKRAAEFQGWNYDAINEQAAAVEARLDALLAQKGTENWSDVRTEMCKSMESGCGIYRDEAGMQATIDKLAELRLRYKNIQITDKGKVFNTDLLYAIEVGFSLDVAEAMAHSAIQRRESRGAHQRLDEGCNSRNDKDYLKHSLALYNPNSVPTIKYSEVKITKSQPQARLYGDAAKQQEKV
ncbi:fumarate reductase flavoprotein subunit [Shewanella putrefaciens]|nr:fumarate reductase flavoprotein subunit [Shewanella putrefaciens]